LDLTISTGFTCRLTACWRDERSS